MKKAIFILAALAMVLSLILVSPVAKAEEYTEGEYTYEVTGGKATIVGCDENSSGDITIPATLGGYPVTAIGENAFAWCSELTSITIPNGVTTIGANAFEWCSELTSITIPASVTSIGKGALSCGSGLQGVWVDKQNPNYCNDSAGNLYNKDKTVLVRASNAAAQGAYTVPENVTTIGDYAFSRCGELISVTMGSNVTTIGEGAFSMCSELWSATIGSGVTTIGAEAFDWCESMYSVTIPAGVTSIGHGAFFGCIYLSGIWVDENNPNYCSDSAGVLFDKEKTILIQAPAQFEGAYLVPNSVITIGEKAFQNCNDLTAVKMGDNVTSIGNSAFYNCNSLTLVEMGGGVTTIGKGAFGWCITLDTVTIGSAVTSIGEAAFKWCNRLTDVYYGGTMEQWGQIQIGADNTYLKRANVYYGVTDKPDELPDNTPNVQIVAPGATGNLDNNNTLDEDDVIYLLQHLLMPEEFPVAQSVDYDKNGVINEDDVIYLLQHLLMPEEFPLV